MPDLKSLPVYGYADQPQRNVTLVNSNKVLEEQVLRHLDALSLEGKIDYRWYAIGRTHIEQGFMAINRAVFQPNRIELPSNEDENTG
jgi:hypothetical protein